VSLFSRNRVKPVQALHRVRHVEYRQAEARMHLKSMEILKLKAELQGLKERRAAVLRRPTTNVLRERILLDSLVKLSVERTRKLEALSLQSAVLLGEYRLAKSRKDAAEKLRERRRLEEELVTARREDEAALVLTASRFGQEIVCGEDESCDDC